MEKLSEVINPITTNGIFHTLYAKDSTLAWLDATIVDYLDKEYYLGHSGQKYTSRLYDYLRKAEDDGDIASALEQMALILLTRFKGNWNKIYEAYTATYNPINNYDMSETETVASKVTTTVGTDTSTYGFNSDDAVPTGKAENKSTTEGSANDNIRSLTRSGNIGVTTSAQMVDQEIKLRNFQFYQQVMNDIDSVMCLGTY